MISLLSYPGSLSRRRLQSAGLLALLAVLALGMPALADPVLDKAQTLLKTGHSDSAAAIYREYLRQHPGSLEAQRALAEIALRRFEYDTARAMLEKTLAQHPDAPEVAAELGRLYQLWSNLPGGEPHYKARAQEHFAQALAHGADNPLVLTYVANWQIEQDDLVSAEKNLQQALKLDYTFVPAYQGQIRFYIKVRDLGRARDAALHAMELDALNAETYFLTARLLALANRPAEAVQYAEKSEQLDFGKMPERDYFLAAQYEKLGQLEPALEYYNTLTVYAPQDAKNWLKLAELYDRLDRREPSMAAYRKALALQPELSQELKAQAAENTRNEKIELAMGQWRRLLDLQPENTQLAAEGLANLASLHALNHFYNPTQPSPNWGADWDRFAQAPPYPALALDRVKMQLASQGLTPAAQQALVALGSGPDPAVAGEALFIAGRYGEARQRLEEVIPQDAGEALRLADRLMLDQELNFSKAFYQQAFQDNPDPSVQAAIKRIQAKQTLAGQRVTEGDQLFAQAQYEAAAAKYEEATRIDRQGDHAYLRLADTYQQLKRWTEARQAYDQAVSLAPSLMDSPGFAKNYEKVKKRASKS